MDDPPVPAAPIQASLMGYDWQVVRDGLVIGHYRTYAAAKNTARHYEGSIVRPSPVRP